MNEPRCISILVRFALVLLLACLGTARVDAASWYVDSSASGANNGTSWANAWTSFGAIQWGSVQPGDNVWISGGATASSKTYTSQLNIDKSGTSGARITVGVKVDDPAHNGTVIIDGNYINLPGRAYITLTGNVNGARKFRIQNFFSTQVAEWANAVWAESTTGIKFDSIAWDNVNNLAAVMNSTGLWFTNCYARGTRGDALIRASSVYGAGWDGGAIIENCDFEVLTSTLTGGNGPDGIQTGNNMTIRNNTFRVRQVTDIYTSVQHCDMIQAPGAFIAIYNNDFINVGDSSIQLHGWYPGSTHSNIHIYNNIFRIVDAIDPFPQYIRLYNVGYPIQDISNLVIANNLFLDNGWQNIETDIKSVGGNPTGSGNKIVNNIFRSESGGGIRWNLDWSSNWSPGAWQIDGNVYYPANSIIRTNGINFNASVWVPAQEPNGSTADVQWASYTPNNLNNNLRLSGSDTTARNTGLNLSSYFTTDKDGTSRPQSVVWDKGPYEYPGSAPSSILELSTATATVAEDAETVTLRFRRTGSTSGAVGCSYATANGTAVGGVNYAISSGTVSWSNGDGAEKTVLITVHDVNMLDTKTFTVTISSPTGGAVIGSQSTTTVSITATGTPPEPLLSGWSWPATNGVVAAPFVAANGYVAQPGDNNEPAQGGSLRFTFTNNAGTFKFTFEVDAPSTAANSCFFQVGTEPTSPTHIFDVVQLTTGFENREATWRGNGTFETPQFSPALVTLPGGTNTLIIRGREPLKIRRVTMELFITEEPEEPDPVVPTVANVTSSLPPGYFKAGGVIPVIVSFSTNVVVTGSPYLIMNTGASATYTSGSGGTNLTFTYTVAAGENTQRLDYSSTNALKLNGGTIKNDVTDADLTLAAPSAPGSLASGVVLVVDTIRPVVTISAPVPTITSTGDVNYTVTVSDVNLGGVALSASSVTVTATGSATGTATISGGVTLTGISGEGTLAISLSGGSAADLAGNIDIGAGPSPVVTVTPPGERKVVFGGRAQLKGRVRLEN